MRFPGLIALFTLCAALASAGEEVVLDRVVLKGRGAGGRWIVSETMEDQKWKQGPDGNIENTTKRNTVTSVTYAFQITPGAYTQGMEARQRGRLAESAALFAQLASGGTREAEKVVGSFEEGVSHELDGKFDNAAKAFARVVSDFPLHPLILDAQYRQGMALAQAKNAAEAEAVAQKLDALGKGKIGQAAIVRCSAIRAALAQQAGKETDFRTLSSKAAFSAEYDRASWMHFNLYIADTFRAMGKSKDAVTIYDRMLRGLANDPANSARVRLGLGVCKAETDPEGAILDLLTLDAMPYGSGDQKCEARYHAGKLLLASAQEAQKDPALLKDERKASFMKENLRTARLLLAAAADATSSVPAKGLAAELLKTIPDEAPAKAEPAAVDPDKPEAAKPEAGKPAAGKPDGAKAPAPETPKKTDKGKLDM